MSHVRRANPVTARSTEDRPDLYSSSAGPLTLIVDGDSGFRRYLRTTLGQHGYRILEAGGGEEGLEFANRYVPDLVLLNPELPDMAGMAITRQLRLSSRAPILVLSESNRIADKVALLDAGADDYLEKPVSMPELMARLRVAQRHIAERGSAVAPRPFESGPLRVDLMGRRVWVDEKPVRLTAIEYRLLSVLIEHANRVVTHHQLLTAIWGPDRTEKVEYLRVYMRSLRRKLEVGTDRTRIFVTEPGIGYRFVSESDEPEASSDMAQRRTLPRPPRPVRRATPLVDDVPAAGARPKAEAYGASK